MYQSVVQSTGFLHFLMSLSSTLVNLNLYYIYKDTAQRQLNYGFTLTNDGKLKSLASIS